jgi:thiol-disulfide isomerase/thioredoxin
MLKIKKKPSAALSLFFCFTVLLSCAVTVSPVFAQDKNHGIPSLGNGAYEIMMFTDYLCPPCRRMDLKAEPLLKELLTTGKVKITFVDVPFSAVTPMYAKYYLYSVNAGTDKNSILRIRRVLFDAAQGKNIKMEDELIAYLKEQKIFWKAMNEKSIYPLLSALIKENKVDETPTCVIKYSSMDIKKYVGTEEIWIGLTQLKARLTNGRK